MNEDPDVPHGRNIPRLAEKKPPKDSGTFARSLEAEVVKQRQRARQMREQGDAAGAVRQERAAGYLERQATRLRDPQEVIGGPLLVGNGGEVMPAEPGLQLFQEMVQQPPDMLAAEATEHRLALTAGVSQPALTLALEMSESLDAPDPLERNLVHGIAAMQTLGMTLVAKANAFAAGVSPWHTESRQQLQSIEAARLATAAARVMDSMHRGVLALERYRNGGKQVVTVQHVTVQDGGQAVVTGTVKPRRQRQ